MNASPRPESVCPSCGEELPRRARFCPACGASLQGDYALAATPGPANYERVEPRWFGLPVAFVLLCLAFAAVGAAVGLFATGHWPWGAVAIFVAVALFGSLAEITRDGPRGRLTERSSRLAADGRAQAATAAEVWRSRLDASLVRRRSRSELDRLEDERVPVLQALGTAAWSGDAEGEEAARRRLRELEAERERVESELASHLAGAEERIRRARLPVEDTVMIGPNDAGSVGSEAADARPADVAPERAPGPSPPYPPPGEADPPQPAQVPEPYPPPDEGTPPAPAPGPDDE